jgi:hypothetical protein
MDLTEIPPIPTDILERLASIPGASLLDIAEAAYERGFAAGVDYKTLRAREAAQKKDAAIAWDKAADSIAKSARFRSELERHWFNAMTPIWDTLVYEPETFWTTLKGKNRPYTPDWRIQAPDGRTVYLETKPASWLTPPRTNPYRGGYAKQRATMQSVVGRNKLFLYVLSGTPTNYECFQVLGIPDKDPMSHAALARLGKWTGIPADANWSVNKPE